jgi:two-component system NtrC family response regulator
MVKESGHSAKTAFSIEEGITLARAEDFDVVFLDVRLPDGSGLDAIPTIQALPFPPEIIIITAFGEKNGASKALKSGVWDYIEKPARIDAMKMSLNRALQYRGQKKVLEVPTTIKREGIIGDSPNLQMCISRMAHAARSEADVLIRGETGTGKELFARAIHQNSTRASNRFIVVDCTALPRDLAESILFGHAKGAFTGADKPSEGLVKQADQGTLFLDEIGELSFNLQKTFLRVLQERRYRPVGSDNEVKSDFRLVSATNRNIESEVEAGRFRQDLLFRLGTFVIELPALRERISDIKDIAVHYVKKISKKYGWGSKKISNEFMKLLNRYTWPGNIRELVSTLESAVVMEPMSPTLYPKHLPEHIRALDLELASSIHKPIHYEDIVTKKHGYGLPKWKEYRRQALETTERQYLKELMTFTNSNIKSACEVSGLKRARLYELLKKIRQPNETDNF